MDGASRWQIFQVLNRAAFPVCPAQWNYDELGARLGRVRSNDDLRREFSRPDADHADRDLPGIRKKSGKRLTLSVILVVISFFSLLVIKVLVSHGNE